MKKSLKQQIEEQEGGKFPSKSYTEMVLKPAFNEAKYKLTEHILQINYAHLIMLVEQKLMDEADARKICLAIRSIDIETIQKSEYNPQFEDLFFQLEGQLLQHAGDIAGNLHIARSRNDMGIAIYRMTLREKLLFLLEEALKLRSCLISLTVEHKDTIMIGYTHTQQAQPTTLAHYLNAMTDLLTRDIERILSAYENVNRSSMGAAALTTSGFHINRNRMKELLGFDTIIHNAWDAVSGADYLAEIATTVQLAALNLGRSIQDFLLWGTQEFGAFKLADPYVQISSIMPQKRNPVSLEHLRALLSSVVGDTQTVTLMIHNTPFGDIVDTEDDLQPYLWRAIDKLQGIYQLLACILGTMTVNRTILLKRAQESFANVTELADTLVRKDGISFRQAHHVVSSSVKKAMNSDKSSLKDLTLKIVNEQFTLIIGKPSSLTEEQFNKSLSPEHFVNIRVIEGGPSPASMNMAIERCLEEQLQWEEWLQYRWSLLEEAYTEVENIIEKWMI
ncbi:MULTISPECIES: argininosuccinate lyase [Bacillus]|uniref:argininosuccinate lyase n=1 Tax=Bacillus TaxID=1386 RepID=UPI0002E4C06E|nr:MULTISPECIES: argininosuccinate lyase [Bacillus]